MKQILKNKQEDFVGRTLLHFFEVNDYNHYKVYIFDDAVLVEKQGYHYDYSVMSKRDVLNDAVYVNVRTDRINFDYENSSESRPIYNIISTEIEITNFGKHLIDNVFTEHELMVYANEEAARQTKDVEAHRQRHINECIAILSKYNIEVNYENLNKE